MLGRRRSAGPLDDLSPRERDVLAEMAEGKSNRGIAEALFVSEAAVEKHVTSIFRKLKIEPTTTEHRRVLAVLRYLSAAHPPRRARRGSPAERSGSVRDRRTPKVLPAPG